MLLQVVLYDASMDPVLAERAIVETCCFGWYYMMQVWIRCLQKELLLKHVASGGNIWCKYGSCACRKSYCWNMLLQVVLYDASMDPVLAERAIVETCCFRWYYMMQVWILCLQKELLLKHVASGGIIWCKYGSCACRKSYCWNMLLQVVLYDASMDPVLAERAIVETCCFRWYYMMQVWIRCLQKELLLKHVASGGIIWCKYGSCACKKSYCWNMLLQVVLYDASMDPVLAERAIVETCCFRGYYMMQVWILCLQKELLLKHVASGGIIWCKYGSCACRKSYCWNMLLQVVLYDASMDPVLAERAIVETCCFRWYYMMQVWIRCLQKELLLKHVATGGIIWCKYGSCACRKSYCWNMLPLVV